MIELSSEQRYETLLHVLERRTNPIDSSGRMVNSNARRIGEAHATTTNEKDGNRSSLLELSQWPLF